GRFSVEHDFATARSLLDPTTLLAGGVLLLWVAVGVFLLLKHRWRIHGFLLLWVPVTLAIESSVVPLEMVFEHRMYLPAVGLAGLLALGLHRLMGYGRATALVAPGLALVIVAALTASTLVRVPQWRSERILYQQAVRHAPGSARAWGNLGVFHLEEGEPAAAFQALQRALAIDPDDSQALETLGVLYLDRGDLVRAERLFRRALESGSVRPSLYNHLGEVHLAAGRNRRALEFFHAARRSASWNPVYYWNLAVTYERENRCREAYDYWQQYLSIAYDINDRRRVREHIATNYRTGDDRTLRCR
ncbi:MAG: tetratricopeptide repeat protein, partial [Candidatus Competibacterales bacterium]|nr:tetratricopeptide repeat protein [Candidatus Competibacterales bacterium]